MVTRHRPCEHVFIILFIVALGISAQNSQTIYFERCESEPAVCVKESTTIDIAVSPDSQLINQPFSVNSTIGPRDGFMLDTVEVRVFTQFPDIDQGTVGVFHLDRSLVSAANGMTAAGSMVGYTDDDALFGNSAMNQGSFSTSLGIAAGDFTLEGWVKLSEAGGKTDVFSGNGFTFGVGVDRMLYFSTEGGDPLPSSAPVDAGIWTHVAVSRLNGNVILCINGMSVSDPRVFTGTLTGVLTVSCPEGGVLDEVRISGSGRMRSEDSLTRLDVPLLNHATWTIDGTSSTRSVLTLPSDKWTASGTKEFQFSSPVAGRLVVNFYHRGTLQTRWSKNGNPVLSVADMTGPYVQRAIFTKGPADGEFDTLRVVFSEPVKCDSLKKNIEPSASFRIYGPGRVLKQDVLEGAVYLNGTMCAAPYISEVTVLTPANAGGITPISDSIRLFGTTVDTARNYPGDSCFAQIAPHRNIGIKGISANRERSLPFSFDIRYDPNSSSLHIAVANITPAIVPINVQVFDIRGRLLATIFDNELQPGYHTCKLSAGSETFADSFLLYRMNVKGFFTKTVRAMSVK